MSQHKFKTTNIKGKQYVEVNERVKAFRALPEFKSMSLETEIYAVDSESVIIRAVVRDEAGRIVSTGFAHEEKSSFGQAESREPNPPKDSPSSHCEGPTPQNEG